MCEENQERAYIAASRRTDRSLEARVQSAQMASKIHEKRTGKALRISEAIVMGEDMYEDEDQDFPRSYPSAETKMRADAYLTHPVVLSKMVSELERNWRENEVNRAFAEAYPHQDILKRWSSSKLPDFEPTRSDGLYVPQDLSPEPGFDQTKYGREVQTQTRTETSPLVLDVNGNSQSPALTLLSVEATHSTEESACENLVGLHSLGQHTSDAASPSYLTVTQRESCEDGEFFKPESLCCIYGTLPSPPLDSWLLTDTSAVLGSGSPYPGGPSSSEYVHSDTEMQNLSYNDQHTSDTPGQSPDQLPDQSCDPSANQPPSPYSITNRRLERTAVRLDDCGTGHRPHPEGLKDNPLTQSEFLQHGMSDIAKRARQRNRTAANKFRAKKNKNIQNLREKEQSLRKEHEKLESEVSKLRYNVTELKSSLLLHHDCDCSLIQDYITNEATKLVRMRE
ncbi:hypothetical protein BGZ63DRAFT_429656 [Mariannaea sp. PMI_226]|nr:hypothetical protein BGZ63DRAFT_429656 [Mariannaea sp. PMI_226]